MMTKDDDLDTLFATAADHREVPSAPLVARILADAAALQPRPALAVPSPAAPRGWLASLADIFGGGASWRVCPLRP